MTYRLLALGDKVTFHDTGRKPFNVRAVSPDHQTVILSRPLDGGASAEYTMIDWEHGMRGSDGTGGRGLRIASQAHHRLHRFFKHHPAVPPSGAGAPSTQSVLTFGSWVPVLIATVNGHP